MASWSVFDGWSVKQKLLQNWVALKITQALFTMQVAMARYDFNLLISNELFRSSYKILNLKHVYNFVGLIYSCSLLVQTYLNSVGIFFLPS